MNDLTPLHDDSLDDGLRSALLQIDRGPAMTVDVDEVLRRGARHRRVVALERVGAVAAVALVVVGAGSFALTRTNPTPAPVAPAASLTPTPTQVRVVPPSIVLGSSGTAGTTANRRGLTGIEVVNTGKEPVTVSIQDITGYGATVKAVLKQVPLAQQDVLEFNDALLTSVDRPGPASVSVPPGQYVLLVLSAQVATCPTSAAAVDVMATEISSTVTLSLRSASGGTGTIDATQSDGTTPDGWVRTGLAYACGFPPKS